MNLPDPLKPSADEAHSREKLRNSMAWVLISLLIGLLAGFDGGWSFFQAFLKDAGEGSAELNAQLIPLYAYFLCLLSLIGQALGEAMTEIAWLREQKKLGQGNGAGVLQRNLFDVGIGWLVSFQEKVCSAGFLLKIFESELLQKLARLWSKAIGMVGGISGIIYLAIYLRSRGEYEEYLSWLQVGETSLFTLYMLIMACTSAPSLGLLLLYGLDLALVGILGFIGGPSELLVGFGSVAISSGMSLVLLLLGIFVLLVFLRSVKLRLAEKS